MMTTPFPRQTLLSGVSCLLVGWLFGASATLPAKPIATPNVLPAAPRPYPDSLDAVVAAAQFHRILFENERVRVLEVTVPPHQREPLHTHRWPSVLYRELSCPLRYYDATGTIRHESAKPYRQGPTTARARWQEPEGPHAVENMGEVTDRFVRVEWKQ